MSGILNDVLDRCYGYGGPLLSSDREAIQEYVRQPSEEGWNRIKDVVVNPNYGLGLSVENALVGWMLNLDASVFSRENMRQQIINRRIQPPSGFNLVQALKFVTARYEKQKGNRA